MIVDVEKLPSGMAMYYEARKAFGENALSATLSVALKLLKMSMDLTDLVRDAWEGDPWEEIEERLDDLTTEYQEVEQVILNGEAGLGKIDAQGFAIECARFSVQLEEIGETDSSSQSSSSSESESECGSVKAEVEHLGEHIEEVLVRKVPHFKIDVV